MMVQLWDTATANLIGEYHDEALAMRDVRLLMASNGADFVARLTLAHEDAWGETFLLATGPTLIQRLAS